MAYPLPPVALVTRVGTVQGADPYDFYLREGSAVRGRIERMLPADWSWAGKRALDFGCGSGRVLRHFLELDPAPELWGCDIDGASIEWLQANLKPLHVFRNELMPPLPVQDGFFDLIWATSVFTHIDRWSEWLLEMHRVLAPGGVLIASWLGEGIWDAMVGEPYRPAEIGVTVLRHWQVGGAWVFHSEWWLREHWGRAFDVLAITPPPRLPDGSPEVTHSYIALRAKPGQFTAAELERPAPEEPRELAGMQTNLRLLRAETDGLLDGSIEGPEPEPTSGWRPGPRLRQTLRRSPLADPLRNVRRELRARRR
ncbi:MAG: class I SAM-dependent methyltransferase [Solirubrobacteraceae bacterium]